MHAMGVVYVKKSKYVPVIITTVQITLIVLKLMNLLDLSWTWVLCPIWIPVALLIAFIILALLVSFLLHLFGLSEAHTYPDENEDNEP
jgi:hypothetical protein